MPFGPQLLLAGGPRACSRVRGGGGGRFVKPDLQAGESARPPMASPRPLRRLFAVAPDAVEPHPEPAAAALGGHDSRAALPGRIVADVLVVPALQLGAPMFLLVLVKTCNSTLHPNPPRSLAIAGHRARFYVVACDPDPFANWCSLSSRRFTCSTRGVCVQSSQAANPSASWPGFTTRVLPICCVPRLSLLP